MTEPGQIAHEAALPADGWKRLTRMEKAAWALAEAAVRADQIERCAKVAEERAESCRRYGLDEAEDEALAIAAAIRGLAEPPNKTEQVTRNKE